MVKGKQVVLAKGIFAASPYLEECLLTALDFLAEL